MIKGQSYTNSHKNEGKGAQYDEHYKTDRWYRSLWHQEQHALKDLIETYLGGRQIHLLDFACGTGRICGFLEPYVATAVGVDVSESMLEIARQNAKRTVLIRADLTVAPILSGRKFNLITAFRFFLNAEPKLRKAALLSIVPLLADDGYFVFNNHRNSTAPLVRFKYSRSHRPRNFMSMEEMHELVNEFGLEIIKIYPVGFLSLPKIKLPPLINSAIDSFAARFKFLQNFSESPIMVCRLASKPKLPGLNKLNAKILYSPSLRKRCKHEEL